MTDTYISPFSEGRRSSWIRLRTLILLRWAAIFGQISAIFIAIGYFNLQIELFLCLIAIGVSIAANIGAMFVFPGNKRLSETQNMLMILFDVLQLGFLLYLTGGLQNPFSILLLAPVAVSASVLTLRSTIVLGGSEASENHAHKEGSAIVVATVLSLYHIPLTTIDGLLLGIPDIFIFGNWIAIVIALIFLSVYSRWITSEMNAMGDALLATQMALSREQKLTDLGGVVAAAAHELGTPLATIKLTSAELMEELQGQPELYEDAELIKKQADRCRDILRSMGRVGKSDKHLRSAPISEIIREAAEPHTKRGIKIESSFLGRDEAEVAQPIVFRHPEIIHGLRNLMQNAVDFSRSKVLINVVWSKDALRIEILDDGPGFPVGILSRIGDPFMGTRRSENTIGDRPGYEGMGLGLFIAKTLLERTGAELTFANDRDAYQDNAAAINNVGAVVTVAWQRSKIEQP
ncbi:MAG: sensor histidine kinase RegB, partial [Paracoccaceae bacterium]